MKKILYVLLTLFICNYSLAAGSDDSESSKVSMYDEAVKLIKRAGKLEKKDKNEKAAKLYQQAFNKLDKAYKKNKKNPDILNYMGYTSRKIGNFDGAEKYSAVSFQRPNCIFALPSKTINPVFFLG